MPQKEQHVQYYLLKIQLDFMHDIKAAFNKFHKHRNSDISLINWFHLDFRSYFGVRTTKMSLMSIKTCNMIVAKSEVQFLFA
jgi:hypothetical protein